MQTKQDKEKLNSNMTNAIEIKINQEALTQFVEEGGKLMLKKEAGDSILSLLRLSRKLENYLREVKNKIIEAAAVINPGFKGVFGKDIKGVYKTTGRKYSYDKNIGNPEDLLARGLIRPLTIYVPVSEAIEALEARGESLPVGLVKNERNKDLYFQVKEDLLLDNGTNNTPET